MTKQYNPLEVKSLSWSFFHGISVVIGTANTSSMSTRTITRTGVSRSELIYLLRWTHDVEIAEQTLNAADDEMADNGRWFDS